ncbi:MAG: hypothetical protein RLZZ306_642 [Bacteroidota bacterium]
MYNHPSVDDDFCFAYMTRDYGFWEAQKFYYDGWSGRYISNMIFHATPLAFGNFWFVKVMPFLIFGFLFHAIYTFIGEVLKQSKPLSVSSKTTPTTTFQPPLSVSSQTTITITFLSIFIIFSPSIVDTFYWYSSVFIFPTSFSFFLYLIVVLLRFYQPQYQRIKYLIALLAATLVFFIVGSNEVMMLFIIGFLGIIWGYILLFQKRFDFFIFALMLIGLYFAYFWVVQAKGNQVRLVGGNVLGGAIALSLTNALKSTIFDGLKWSLILSPFAYIYMSSLPNVESVKEIFKANVWMVILGLFTLLFMMFFVIHYGNDMGVPDRVKNVIFAVFLIGFFYIVAIIKYSYSVDYKIKSPLINYGITALMVGFFIFQYGQNLKIMYADIRLGIAKRYDKEMTQRYTQIKESKSDTVYIAPLKNVPKSLCFDDIKTNEKHLWNKCYANYFEKKVIILKE